MLLCTKSHFIKSLQATLDGKEGPGTELERQDTATAMRQRVQSYATDESGLAPGVDVWHVLETQTSSYTFETMFQGKKPMRGQRIVYVDGGFDLFSSGHIEFLRSVINAEESKAQKSGWYDEEAKSRRISEFGVDYAPCYVVAGIHNDEVINSEKGLNYPIMNIFERGLCLLQCKVCIPHQPRQHQKSPLPQH